jgi:DNA-binding HxlR family transcriptional regulator
LIVRDLLLGARRFTDLARSLIDITPTRLTRRPRQLEAARIVVREPLAGREVHYRLPDAGRYLGPVIDALALWGIEHARQPPRRGEPVHPDPAMIGTKVWLNRFSAPPARPVAWVWRFPGDDPHTLSFDGARWTLARGDAAAAAVTVTATPDAWARFLTNPASLRRLPLDDVKLEGRRADMTSSRRPSPPARSPLTALHARAATAPSGDRAGISATATTAPASAESTSYRTIDPVAPSKRRLPVRLGVPDDAAPFAVRLAGQTAPESTTRRSTTAWRAGSVKAWSGSGSHDLVRNRRASIPVRCFAAMTHEIPTDHQPTRLTAAPRFWRNRLFARIRHDLTWLQRSSALITRMHAAAVRASGGRIRRSFLFTGGMPILVLTTVGRKSGQRRFDEYRNLTDRKLPIVLLEPID